MHLIVQQDKPGDWVVSTGETRSVRDMCEYVFSKLGLNYKNYITQNPKFIRPEELPYLKGDSSKIRTLGWKPEYTFETMMDEMIEYWFNILNNKK
jgi:GDPmannose 4,6-dehydratase